MKALETEPVSQEESNRAAGMGSYIPPKKFEIQTIQNKEALVKLYENKKDIVV